MKNNNIFHQVPEENKIKRILKENLFGKFIYCPTCGSRSIKKYENRYFCKHCRRKFTLTSVCWLKGAKLSLQDIWLLLIYYCNNTPIDQASEYSGCSIPTVRNWYSKFRNNIPKEITEDIRLSNIVAMDECYKGGKKNGYSILGAKEKGTKKAAMKLLKKNSVNRRDAIDFITNHIKPNTILNTDGSKIYKTIEYYCPVKHQSEIHYKFQFTLTSEIEGLWGNLTNYIRRTYHHVTKEKIEEILYEFTSKQNNPKMFENPTNFLENTLNKLPRTLLHKRLKTIQNIMKNNNQNFTNKILILNPELAKKQYILVPSC